LPVVRAAGVTIEDTAMATRTSTLDEIGDRDAPPGSRAWSVYFAFQARKTRHQMNGEARGLLDVIHSLRKHEAWKALGYASFNLMLDRECDLSGDDVERLEAAGPDRTIGFILGPHRGPAPMSMTNAARVNAPDVPKGRIGVKARRGTEAYLRARLARDFPAIKARLDAGEFRSARAAAREAGLVRPTATIYTDDPEAAAAALRRHFKGDRLAELAAALAPAVVPCWFRRR
jgi:hypothetical protein